VNCLGCQIEMRTEDSRASWISIAVMGDEYIYSYWNCPACRQWTVESYHDRFMGDDEIQLMGPFPPEVGERCVALIEVCPDPGEKNCDCKSHQALYYGTPRE